MDLVGYGQPMYLNPFKQFGSLNFNTKRSLFYMEWAELRLDFLLECNSTNSVLVWNGDRACPKLKQVAVD